MLLAPLYHQIDKCDLPSLDAHLKWIKEHYNTVHPGDPLSSSTNICLTFDDATFDFYHHVFPLLKKYELKALLSVPTAFIPESTLLTPDQRLSKITPLLENSPPLPSPAFCTWDELKVLANSGLVHIASHSLNHRPLTNNDIDPNYELLSSKTILQEKLDVPISTFVYPFGRFNNHIHSLAKNHYRFIMRIGNALNLNWQNTNQLLYRFNANNRPYTFPKKLKHFSHFLLNTLRCK